MESQDAEAAKLIGIVLEVANVKPYKMKRLKFLVREHRDLLEKLDETGLLSLPITISSYLELVASSDSKGLAALGA